MSQNPYAGPAATLTHQGLNIVLQFQDINRYFPTVSAALAYCQRHKIEAHFAKPQIDE